MEYKFKVGDCVTNKYTTRFGTVIYIDHEDDDGYLPYKVHFSSTDYEWCSEDDLSAVNDDVKVIVDQSNCKIDAPKVTVPMEIKHEGRKYDSGKPMYNLIPADALEEVVRVLTYGAVKYNEPIHEENWRKVDHPEQRYFAAMQRHVWATRKGEMNDPESGISHYAHAITSLLFLLQKQIEQNASST